MTTDRTRYCRVCGDAFTASPADTTVNCPRHRRRSRPAAAKPNPSRYCSCGKTTIVDGFGHATGWTCPQCGDS